MDIHISARQLRIERLRRGWTLKQVSDLTRISITVLKLLEEGSFGRIGEEPMIEMLLRTYSKALGDMEASPGSSSTMLSESGGRQAGSRKFRAGSYLLPVLASSLIIVVVAGLGLLYRDYRDLRLGRNDRSAPLSSNILIPEVRIDNRTDRSRIEKSDGAPGDKKKNEATQSGEPTVVSSAGTENQADKPSVVKNDTQLNREEGKELPGGEGANVATARTEQQEASSEAETVHNGQSGSQPTPGGQASAPEEKSGPEDALKLAAADTRPIDVSHLLEMNAGQKTWIQVTIDGIKPESELLQPGERRKWKALERVDLVIGNRGGVQLKWDGRPVDLSNKTARVIRISLSGSGIVLK